MGLFGNSGKTPAQSINWIDLEKEEDLENIISRSFERPQVVFKHSTRCGISRSVLNRLEKEWSNDNVVDMYLLDLLRFRSVSNLVADKLGVWHESPQLIVIGKGEVIAHGSHHNADARLIEQATK